MKIKTFLKFGLLLFFSVFPSIVLVEFAYKLIPRQISILGQAGANQYTFDNITGYSLRKNISDQVLGVNTDEFGNRITFREYDNKKRSILFVGDSTVFGWGVVDTESYVYLLSKNPKFSCLNIINLGVPSYSLGNIKKVISEKSIKYNPVIIFTSITWPWKPFEDEFYGTNPSEDWKKVNIDFFKENIISRDGYKRRYIFGHYTKYLIETLLGRFKLYILPIIKNSFDENSNFLLEIQDKERYVVRPGIRDFDITPKEELNYANDHLLELKKAENNLKSIQVTNPPKFFYYMHPYYYTINIPKYSSKGKLGYDYLVKNLPAIDMKSKLIDSYLSDVKLKDIYFDGSHLTPKGNEIWSEIIERKLLKELENSNISCDI